MEPFHPDLALQLAAGGRLLAHRDHQVGDLRQLCLGLVPAVDDPRIVPRSTTRSTPRSTCWSP
ncbi:MAG TPA: hypothetical protein VD864_06590 [Nocardioides sp.]|nr:hypothetical protein [Nocardioides sp.]